ncbi:MAG: hypothetical protein EOP48_00555 [Sphingobacteriales bacterium]|nr:MAG: hypothetical protein EOP48_00555 [Sphingobacteriales bacterium]
MGKPKRRKQESNRSKRRNLERTIEKGASKTVDTAKELLFKLKYKLVPSQSQPLIDSFSTEQFRFVIGDLLPKTYRDIRTNSGLYARDEYSKELLWYSHLVLRYTKEINLYLSYAGEFERLLLIADYSGAEAVLDKIESEICVSQVSIEKRLLLAEYQSGFKKNKEVLAQIVDTKPKPLTSLLSKYSSIKVEKNQSYIKYQEVIEKLLKSAKDPKMLEYVRYKLDFFSFYHYQYKGFILSAESSSSIIDMYSSMINMMMLTAAETTLDATLQETMTLILRQLTPIQDRRLLLLQFSLGNQTEIKISASDVELSELLETYTVGNYAEAERMSETYLKSNANCFEVYLIYAKSCIQQEKGIGHVFPLESIAAKSIEDIYHILLKNDLTNTSLQRLHKNFNTMGFNQWGTKAYNFFNEQHSLTQPQLDTAALASLNSEVINPGFALSIPEYNAFKDFLEQLTLPGQNDNVITFWRKVGSTLHKVDYQESSNVIEPFRKYLYQAEVKQKIGLHRESLELYETLEQSVFEPQNALVHNKEDIAHGKLLCYLKSKDFNNALELVTNANVDNPNSSIRFRYNILINEIKDTMQEELIGNISTPIFLHQYQRFITPNDLWIAYDNFLAFHDLNFPREIIRIADQFERKRVIYFLKNICKPEVYDSSYLFESQDHLENERIEVCLLLCELDESNVDEYISEISEISRNQLIRQGIKQIDESKIYVDVVGIRKALDKDLFESFNRFLNLKSLPLSQIQKLDTSNDDFLISYLDKNADKTVLEKSAIRITTYSTFEQFRDMFYKIRNMFIASNEYGIDTYLSMRIRHGTLLGELRSVFETFNLITKREDSSDTYQDNQFWLGKDLFASTEIRNSFNEIMASFSSEIDKLSNELKNQKLQISTETKISGGLFDYSITKGEILNLFKQQVDSVVDHNVFFDSAINFLWEKTEVILAKIREEISGPIKSKILSLLSDLSRKLEHLINKSEFAELNELIRDITLCQTEISNKLDKISEWFNRTNNKVINEFFLDLPIDAAKATLKRLDKEYKNFDFKINNLCDIKFEGDTFPHFTYIMQNLLHNILKHSKLSCEELQIDINLLEEEGILTIEISNNISETIKLIDINKKIKKTRKLLKGTHNDERTRKEDGTGYLKIKKTIITDLLREEPQIILADVDEQRQFKTTIKFKITDLEKN